MARVEAGMVGVVRHETEAATAGLEQLVPVHGGQPPPHLELAAGVPDLDPGDVLRQLERAGSRTRPVGMREVGDAAVLADETPAVRFEIGVLGAERSEVGVRRDPNPSTWPSRAAGRMQFSSTLGSTSRRPSKPPRSASSGR